MGVLRKSGFEDAFFFIAVIFAIAIFGLVIAKAWNSAKPELDSAITSSLPENSSINISTTLNTVTSTIYLLDKLLPLLLIGLFAFVLIGAALYMNHPIMIFVGIIILAIAILLGVIYSNVYNEISSVSEFSEENQHFGITELTMKYLPFILIILFIGILAAIIFSRQGGTNQL